MTSIKNIYEKLRESEEIQGKIQDPWGLDLNFCEKATELLYPIYKNYFRVKLHYKERIQNKPYLIVANHSGQIPIDGMLLMMAFILELDRPRLIRAMVERFLIRQPFLGEMSQRAGQVLGDRGNCQFLLEHGKSVLVFPEGVSGVAKNTWEFYKMKPFSHGFLRMAIIAGHIDILPVSIVGAEEMYPYVIHFRKLAKMLSLPALPITPTFPLLGPIGMVPMPSQVKIFIEEPYSLPKDLHVHSPEIQMACHVENIQRSIQNRLNLHRNKK